jgi:hypothetical protein
MQAMPKRLRPQKNQRRNTTKSSGKWMAIGGFVIGIITAISGAWVAFGTPTPYQFSELLNQKTILTLENKGLQEGINKKKEELYVLTEKKNSLEEQNVALLQKNLRYESKNKETLVKIVIGRVYFLINNIDGKYSIPIVRRSKDGFLLGALSTINYDPKDVFTYSSWNSIIQSVKEELREDEKIGIKSEIKSINKYTLKVLIEVAMRKIEYLGEEEKEFAQELGNRINDYIQKNPEGFYDPLNFVFTGTNMKLSEANRERERLLDLYKVVRIGNGESKSKVHATVRKLFLNVWPSIGDSLSFQFNWMGDWYVPGSEP